MTLCVGIPENSPLYARADIELGNLNPSLNHTTPHETSDGSRLPSGNGNTPRRIEQAPGADMSHDDYDDDNDDNDDYDDDIDDGIEEGEEVREDRINKAAAPFNQPITPNSIQSSQSSRRKQPSKQNDTGGGAAPTRRRLRQRPNQQQQQHHRPHAAVEKRYRSVVNSKIQQLRASIPPSNTFSPVNASTASEGQAANAAQEMPTKSVVLDRATQYINYLVNTYEQYEIERNELRQRLQFWLDNISPRETHPSNPKHN